MTGRGVVAAGHPVTRRRGRGRAAGRRQRRRRGRRRPCSPRSSPSPCSPASARAGTCWSCRPVVSPCSSTSSSRRPAGTRPADRERSLRCTRSPSTSVTPGPGVPRRRRVVRHVRRARRARGGRRAVRPGAACRADGSGRRGWPAPGVRVTAMQAYLYALLGEINTLTPAGRARYHPAGAPPREGDVVTDPELADALDRFGADGPAPFYTGDIAAAVVDWVRAAGGCPRCRRPGRLPGAAPRPVPDGLPRRRASTPTRRPVRVAS